ERRLRDAHAVVRIEARAEATVDRADLLHLRLARQEEDPDRAGSIEPIVIPWRAHDEVTDAVSVDVTEQRDATPEGVAEVEVAAEVAGVARDLALGSDRAVDVQGQDPDRAHFRTPPVCMDLADGELRESVAVEVAE